MLMYRWDLGSSVNHCPSCIGCAGQIHPMETWMSANLYPRSDQLICQSSCNCQLTEVEVTSADGEVGSLTSVMVILDVVEDGERKKKKVPDPEQAQNTLATDTPAAALHPVTNHIHLAAEAQLSAAGDFEIFAITAGDGNGWQFSEDALQNSLSLWEGAESFVDHEWVFSLRS